MIGLKSEASVFNALNLDAFEARPDYFRGSTSA
jgi:hypothetical protein